MEQFLSTEALIIELLLVASLVAIAVRRIRVPYTVALVVAGLFSTFQQSLHLQLTPELILVLFVPPLVFEAALHLGIRHLRENLLPILVLAIPGVLLTTIIVGVIVSFGTQLPLISALVFGALVAATDPVAVVALFRAMGAPKSLTVIVESESLFNDGIAIVLFNLLLALALPAILEIGTPNQHSNDLISGTIEFLRVSIFGIGIGAGLGWAAAWLIGRIDDYLIETTLTIVLAFGAYLVAEQLHVSGVLAVVAAGIICGNFGLGRMSPTTQIALFGFWEYLAFIANSLLFLLIGQDVNIPQLLANSGPIAIAIVAVLASRALAVYGLTWLTNLWKRKGAKDALSRPYQHVLFWGGLRGAISLALALSLPVAFADREILRVMTFGVVLFTLLVQGTTMSGLLGRLGLIHQDDITLEYERRHGQLLAVRAARERVEQLAGSGLISATAWEQIAIELDDQIQTALHAQREWLQRYPALRSEERNDAWREGLRAQRAMLHTLMSNGVISEPIYQELVAKVDRGLAEIEYHGSSQYSTDQDA